MSSRQRLERLLNLRRRTVVGSGRVPDHYTIHRTSGMPVGFGHLARSPDLPFSVALDRVTTAAGFSYHPAGWHPYRAALEEMLDEPGRPYEGSVLDRYYRAFRPRSVAEALAVPIEGASLLATWPPVVELLLQPWAMTATRAARLVARPERSSGKGRRQELGPQSNTFGALQARRIRAVHDNIAATGFRPEAYRDGRLSGYFLVRDGEYRFMVTHGNHRLPALRQLGIADVPVRFDRECPPVVNEAALRAWTGRRRALTAPAAQALFTAQFESLGSTRAVELGLC